MYIHLTSFIIFPSAISKKTKMHNTYIYIYEREPYCRSSYNGKSEHISDHHIGNPITVICISKYKFKKTILNSLK